jgi:hypothetical protein
VGQYTALSSICLYEVCSKMYIGKHLSDAFPIQNGLKQDDSLSLLLNFALGCTSRALNIFPFT